jgi:hypothetical protein
VRQGVGFIRDGKPLGFDHFPQAIQKRGVPDGKVGLGWFWRFNSSDLIQSCELSASVNTKTFHWFPLSRDVCDREALLPRTPYYSSATQIYKQKVLNFANFLLNSHKPFVRMDL